MTTLDRKKHRGGEIVRFEPQYLALIKLDPTIRVAFEKTGCIRFCENLQGYSVQLTKGNFLKFISVYVKVRELISPM